MTNAVPLSIVLGALVAFVEGTRRRADQMDFFTPVSGLVFVCFVLVPIVLPFYESDQLGAWAWLFERGIDHWNNSAAVALAAVLYSITAWAYLKGPKHTASILKRRVSPIPAARLAIVAIALLALATVAIAIFVEQRGGVVIAVTEAAIFKTSEEPLDDLAFSIKLSPFATIASFAFLHLYAESRGVARRLFYGGLLVIAMSAALFGLYLLGGRVSFIFYLLTLLLGELIYRKKRLRFGTAALVFVALIVPVILFGKSALRIFTDEFVWEVVAGDFLDAPASVLRLFVLEFSFPWVNLANFIVLTPDPIGFRWFADVPLGFAYLLPKLLLGIQLPPTINQIYDRVIDTPAPVDLASFGYASAGVAGVIIVAAGYGLILRIAEETFADRGSRLWCLMRAAWILLLGAQVMYGSPYLFLLGGFTLLASTALLLLVPSGAAPIISEGSRVSTDRLMAPATSSTVRGRKVIFPPDVSGRVIDTRKSL